MAPERSNRVPSLFWRLVALWILPPLCVLALVFVTPKIPETYRAWRGHGQIGHLEVGRVEYGKRCRYFGPWVSDGGSRRLPAAWVDDLNRDDCRYRVGDLIQSLFVGNRKTVYISGDYALWFAAVVPLVAITYLVSVSVHLVRRRHRG